MSWFYLILAGLSEIGFTTFLKLSNQFTKLIPSIGFITFGATSFYFMSKAMKDIPMPIVYAAWTGIGIVGVYLVEVLFFNEPLNFMKIIFVSLILIGILGLKLV
ncbi:MAG: multidrug efflux SMR transporter [Candidatus Midichloria sp.]|nr:MAG: multidrug efflux SMR transporter [Candidatus Midichloria sp.]